MLSKINYKLSLILCAAVALCAAVLLPNVANAEETPAYVQDEVIVSYKQSASEGASLAAEADAEVSLLAANSSEQLNSTTVVYKLKSGVSVEEAVAQLCADPRVEFAEPNAYVELCENEGPALSAFFVNDPFAETMQWALVDKNAEMEKVWAKSKVQKKVGVAVIDSGVYAQHEDLKNNLVGAVSVVGEDKDAEQDLGSGADIKGHGTHVCGIVAAEANNSLGVAGISYNANVLSIRAFYRTVTQPSSTSAEIVKAVEYALAHKDEFNIRVINMSFAFNNSGTGRQAVTDAIDKAWEQGVLCCVASGNNSTATNLKPTGFPALYEKAMAVGSIDYKHNKAASSNGDENLDVVAPGVDIHSTSSSGNYVNMSGTSMATPYVAATAALMWANNASLTPAQVASAIKETATDLGDAGKDDEYGYGQVNPLAAIEATDADEPEPSVDEADVHRLYNRYSGEHFYTTSTEERDDLVTLGWTSEDVGWVAPKTGTAPVYRLYNPYSGDHHYTMSEKEYADLEKLGWIQEGVAFYSSTDTNAVPVLRAYNPYATIGTHNFTTSETEQKAIVKLGWKDEGVGWYAQP